MSVDKDLSFVDSLETGEAVQQRCFAAARWPYDCNHFTLRDAEIDVPERLHFVGAAIHLP